MATVGLLVAAGTGERLGTGRPKAFVPCAGRLLLEWSLEVLEGVCDRVVVAVPAGLEDTAADRGTGALARSRSRWVAGAASRSGSVRAALAAVPEAEIAVVHDAARPLVTPDLVERCVADVARGWDGAVAAAPATDTLKEADPSDRRVVRTLARPGVWAVQTPQVFRARELRAALDVDDEALAAAGDDASLVEASGGSVCVVEAPADNLKVTTPVDLRIAEAMLRERGGEGGAGASAAGPTAGTRAPATPAAPDTA